MYIKKSENHNWHSIFLFIKNNRKESDKVGRSYERNGQKTVW